MMTLDGHDLKEYDVDDHGFPGRYTSVRGFVVKLHGQRAPEAHQVIVIGLNRCRGIDRTILRP